MLHDATCKKVHCFGHITFHCRFIASRCTYYNSELFSESGFNLNQTSDDKDAAEFSIAKDNWGQLKSGVSFKEYVP